MLVLLVASLCKSDKVERLYQSEGLPYYLSIEEYCLKQGVPVNEFNKWYRDTHKRIHPIQVSGVPTSEAKEENPGEQPSTKGSVRITVTISMSNGVFVKRKNLSYESLQEFVEKLEALC